MRTGSNKKLYSLNFLLLGIATLLYSAPDNRRADFLIIENPHALKIYNKYEQKITESEYNLFQPFCALYLVNINISLSDNFTLADKITLWGEIFYLLKNDRQSFSLNKPPGYVKEFRNVVVIEDTVIISVDGKVNLQPPAGGQKIRLPAGTRLRRIFVNKKLTYIQTLGESPRYGWCNISDQSTWRRDNHKSIAPVRKEIFDRILPVFTRYNNLYRQCFEYFNTRSGEKRAIPFWQLELKNKRITATLMNISGTNQFSTSFPYLVNEIQQRLLNTGLQLKVNNSQIEIK
jgi:hypothetical protein